MKLSFFGADHCVTGSCHCLEVGGKRILVDCGLQQGRDEVDGNAIYNSVYSTSHLFNELPKTIPMTSTVCNEMSERLKRLLEEMCDCSVPFRRTQDAEVCKYCDFNRICSK